MILYEHHQSITSFNNFIIEEKAKRHQAFKMSHQLFVKVSFSFFFCLTANIDGMKLKKGSEHEHPSRCRSRA